MTLFQLAGGVMDKLVSLMRSSYTLGQLQIMYQMLTDNAAVPDMNDYERTLRAQAIKVVLDEYKNTNKSGSTYNVPPNQVASAAPPSDSGTNAAPVETKTEEPPKMELAKALRLANGVVSLLEDYCDRILIAGSIRRKKPFVKDIEIVCSPKRVLAPGTGLFDTQELIIAPGFRRDVEDLGKVIKGKSDGRYMQIELQSGIKLDLFMPTEHDFFRQYAIRTGSADYSARVIAVGWKKKGWCGTPDGLRLINECEEKSGTWKCVRKNPTLPPIWQSEIEFFAWLGEKWVEPKDRN